MSAAYFALTVAVAASVAVATAGATTRSGSVAAFCSAHPNLDFPGPIYDGPGHRDKALPPDVAAVGATNWRCREGKVYVCAGGASGSACAKMNPSRQPSQDVRETCADNPGQDFVATAVIANSSSTWRCRGSTAEIIETVPLDNRGFMQQTWAPLFDAAGKIDRGVVLGADPR